jgi:hypothetical protein
MRTTPNVATGVATRAGLCAVGCRSFHLSIFIETFIAEADMKPTDSFGEPPVDIIALWNSSIHVKPVDLYAIEVIADELVEETFKHGPISRRQVKALEARKFQLEAYLFGEAVFEHWAKGILGGREKPRGWYEGLFALSWTYAREVTKNFAPHLPPEAKIDRDTWRAHSHARSRKISGVSTKILSEFAEDLPFIREWAAALEADRMDSRIGYMFVLAYLWDCWLIPLRYFSDSAACSVLEGFCSGGGQRIFELDSYRKDIRGDRNGLRLKPPAPGATVVKVRTYEPNTLRVSRSAANRLGLILDSVPERWLLWQFVFVK